MDRGVGENKTDREPGAGVTKAVSRRARYVTRGAQVLSSENMHVLLCCVIVFIGLCCILLLKLYHYNLYCIVSCCILCSIVLAHYMFNV